MKGDLSLLQKKYSVCLAVCFCVCMERPIHLFCVCVCVLLSTHLSLIVELGLGDLPCFYGHLCASAATTTMWPSPLALVYGPLTACCLADVNACCQQNLLCLFFLRLIFLKESDIFLGLMEILFGYSGSMGTGPKAATNKYSLQVILY